MSKPGGISGGPPGGRHEAPASAQDRYLLGRSRCSNRAGRDHACTRRDGRVGRPRRHSCCRAAVLLLRREAVQGGRGRRDVALAAPVARARQHLCPVPADRSGDGTSVASVPAGGTGCGPPVPVLAALHSPVLDRLHGDRTRQRAGSTLQCLDVQSAGRRAHPGVGCSDAGGAGGWDRPACSR